MAPTVDEVEDRQAGGTGSLRCSWDIFACLTNWVNPQLPQCWEEIPEKWFRLQPEPEHPRPLLLSASPPVWVAYRHLARGPPLAWTSSSAQPPLSSCFTRCNSRVADVRLANRVTFTQRQDGGHLSLPFSGPSYSGVLARGFPPHIAQNRYHRRGIHPICGAVPPGSVRGLLGAAVTVISSSASGEFNHAIMSANPSSDSVADRPEHPVITRKEIASLRQVVSYPDYYVSSIQWIPPLWPASLAASLPLTNVPSGLRPGG